MDNNENIFEALNEFEKKNPKEMTPVLEDYLRRIARTGDTVFPWSKLKPVFLFKLDCVMQEFFESSPTDDLPKCPNVENVKFEVMRKRLLDAINNFNSAPFTIQRLCELITNHKKHYTRTDKFLRGIEKNVLVVSTILPGSQRPSYESSAMVNGLLSDSSIYNGIENHGGLIPDLSRQNNSSSSITSWPSTVSANQANLNQGDSDTLDVVPCAHIDDSNKLNNNPDSGVESESDSDDSGLPSDSLIDTMESVSKDGEEEENKDEIEDSLMKTSSSQSLQHSLEDSDTQSEIHINQDTHHAPEMPEMISDGLDNLVKTDELTESDKKKTEHEKCLNESSFTSHQDLTNRKSNLISEIHEHRLNEESSSKETKESDKIIKESLSKSAQGFFHSQTRLENTITSRSRESEPMDQD